MSPKTEFQGRNNSFESIKWITILVLLLLIVIGNYYYRDVTVLFRVLGMIFLMLIASGIALSTTQGKKILTFIREAKTEIRKVIWPTRQETLYTTFIVVVITVIMSMILWGLDTVLVHLVSFIIRLRF